MLLQTVAISFVVLLSVVAAMAVGVIFTGRRITGTCGGQSALPGIDECGVCGRDLRDPSQTDCAKQKPDAGA